MRLSIQDYLNTKRTPLEQSYLDGNIDYEAYVSKRTTEIEVTAFKDLVEKLTFNPLKMPYKHLKAFVIRLLVGIVALSFLIAQVGQVSASPVMIYNIHNNGKTVETVDAQQFYPFKRILSSDLKHSPRYTKKAIKRFPIVSPMLSIGKVKNTKIRSKLPRTICMVGDDKYSKRWIQNKRIQLNASNALCMVVNVDSKQRFNAIKALAPSVEFQALNGDTIAQQLNIKHYPFLLDKGFISQ
jgi:integrating conjugative element protein (TIGR03765 family)